MFPPALPVVFIAMLGKPCLEITQITQFGAMRLKPNSKTKPGLLSAAIPTEGTLSHPEPRAVPWGWARDEFHDLIIFCCEVGRISTQEHGW